jgi:hypothetical protein
VPRAGVDQHLVVYSAAPGTPAAEALALLRVIGLQDLDAGVDDQRTGV